jgi:N6-L-threonylcarbamoyladenine synthase
MSLSGLKTAVLYTVQKIEELNEAIKADIAASFQKQLQMFLLLK